MSRTRNALVAVALALAAMLPAVPALAAGGSYDQVVDLTFPTDPNVHFSHDYDAPRGGGTRVHKATDLMGPKGTPLYAAVEGSICWITGIDEPEPSYGYALRVCGDDGRRYSYIHINNDTPGSDDGLGGPEHAYAPGIRRGVRVGRGQLIGWMGDSGNAESTAPHLHFEIHDDTVTDPYGDTRIDPYNSLVAALERGDVADSTAVATDEVRRVAGEDRIATAIALAARQFDHADHAIIAPADSPAEAIVAGPLAAALDAPVLTTWPTGVDDRVLAELDRLGVEAVTLIGSGLAAGFEQQLTAAGIAQVDRVAGGDRFATAAAVAERVWDLTGDATTSPATPSIDGQPAPSSIQSPTLVASAQPDRSGTVMLDQASVGGVVHVTLAGVDPSTTEQVAFHLDDTEGAWAPLHVESQAPYDLAGTDGVLAGPTDTRDLSNGTHQLTAVVTAEDGGETVVHATFTVDNQGRRDAIVALGDHPDPNRSWPDSLMAAYYGSLTGTPVLLVRPDEVPTATAAALDGVSEVTVVGGPVAVPDGLVGTIGEVVGEVGRLWGETRYETALAVTDRAIAQDLVDASRVWAATGTNWPDAVTAGVIVARAGDALILINGLAPGGDGEVGAWLRSRAGTIGSGIVIGGVEALFQESRDVFARRIT
ncbi:MAG: cell wall-binding repeat-containing protein [Actinobacteria bacterium]|nr:cell wall-binding repeat-containing protein [Actinomycetota bacterium]